jgi:predicted DNA-binding transcriptional regulator AlpA
MTINAIITKLDELIAATRAASIPVRERWLDAIGVGALLGYSGQHVRERLACRKDFPKPARIDGGHARWKAAEVLAWFERQRD